MGFQHVDHPTESVVGLSLGLLQPVEALERQINHSHLAQM